MSTDRTAIEAVVQSAADLQSDVDGLMDLPTDDVVITNIAGRRVLGKDAFRTAMEGALASPLAKVTTTVEVEDVRLIRPDVAIVACVKHVHDERADGADALPSAGSMTYVMQRDDDRWRIALAQTTPRR